MATTHPRATAASPGQRDEEIERLAARALRALARSDRSRTELALTLGRSAPADLVDAALALLTRRGLLDDDAAAARLAGRWLERDLLAPALVRERLHQRGFDENACRAALARHPVDVSAAARALARRAGCDPRHPHRLPQRLLRAGYDEELVRELVGSLGGGDD